MCEGFVLLGPFYCMSPPPSCFLSYLNLSCQLKGKKKSLRKKRKQFIITKHFGIDPVDRFGCSLPFRGKTLLSKLHLLKVLVFQQWQLRSVWQQIWQRFPWRQTFLLNTKILRSKKSHSRWSLALKPCEFGVVARRRHWVREFGVYLKGLSARIYFQSAGWIFNCFWKTK